MPHGTQTFISKDVNPNTGNGDLQLRYNQQGFWELLNEDKSVNRTYTEKEIRINSVLRQRCFVDE